MAERQTPAIVLTVREYGEADLMVNFLTPEYGPLTGIAKHARKSRRRFAHCLEPLSRVVFFLSPRTGRDLEFLQKGELVKSFPALRRDLKRLGAAAVLAEVAVAVLVVLGAPATQALRRIRQRQLLQRLRLRPRLRRRRTTCRMGRRTSRLQRCTARVPKADSQR